jgi:hypothetical protein
MTSPTLGHTRWPIRLPTSALVVHRWHHDAFCADSNNPTQPARPAAPIRFLALVGSHEHSSPPGEVSSGSVVSQEGLLPNRVVKRLIGDQFIQPGVYPLQFLQPFWLGPSSFRHIPDAICSTSALKSPAVYRPDQSSGP